MVDAIEVVCISGWHDVLWAYARQFNIDKLKWVVSGVKIINNSDIKNIINRSERSSVAVTTVGIHYSQDLSEVEKKLPAILNTIKERNSDVFIGSVNYLGVEELSDSSVNLKFTAEVEESNIFTGRRLLNREIKVLFDEAGIEIAFPQVDVHMK